MSNSSAPTPEAIESPDRRFALGHHGATLRDGNLLRDPPQAFGALAGLEPIVAEARCLDANRAAEVAAAKVFD